MDSKASISKGCFVYKNGFKRNKRKDKSKSKKISNLFDEQYESEVWYLTFKTLWTDIEEKIENLNTSTYEQILNDLLNYIENCQKQDEDIIPCATLLTGINRPDHISLFNALKLHLFHKITPHICIVNSQNSTTTKHIVENIVSEFINNCPDDENFDDDVSIDTDSAYNHRNIVIKKSNCNLNVLKIWYQNLYANISKKSNHCPDNNQLVVIIPDFENFNSNVLQDLVLILSSYASVLPFVIIFGVATSVSILHKNFPYHVSSKLHIQVFQSHSSSTFLNEIIENIFLTKKCPFHLGEKTFKLLVDIFLFYDFSVTGFIQNLKYCMMEHFYGSRINSLCCFKKSIRNAILELDHEDLENVRQLQSFRPYVESKPPITRTLLLVNDEYLKKDLKTGLTNFHIYLSYFHKILKILHIFTSDLPNAPLGKQIRELYAFCISSPVVETQQYKECLQILKFLSKEELMALIGKSIGLLTKSNLNESPLESSAIDSSTKLKFEDFDDILNGFTYHLKNITLGKLTAKERNEKNAEFDISEKIDRKKLKEKLLMARMKKKDVSDFEIAREEFFHYLNQTFEKYLVPAKRQPFHEIFFFDNISNIKRHIVGSPRAAIHTALVNPSSYLQCGCCELTREESILPTLPDLSIIYKLYLECGRLINLYDWLQAFLTVTDPIEDDDDEERREIDPKIQARFTRAISEMEFLGFIKTSKRKTDHVTRLTW